MSGVTDLTDPVMIIGLGIVGGLLAELLRWYKLRDSPSLPVYLKSRRYWIVTILMIFAGGFIAWLYGEIGSLNAILAVNVGASAPLILAGLLKTPPEPQQPPGGNRPFSAVDTRSKLREFLSWR